MSDVASLSCTNLHKSFEEGDLKVNVLQGVDLTVAAGERIAIMGSSGSGKSTLLHLLGGLDDPSEGRIQVGGENISVLNERAKSELRNNKLGFIYQFHHLLPEFTALENVALPLLIRGESATTAMREATRLLEKVGLQERLQHKPGELSGGERQRAAIARAMVTRPECILADEPTGNLDEQTAQKVFEVMLELNTEFKVSLLMVTHNANLANRMDAVFDLRDGKLEKQ